MDIDKQNPRTKLLKLLLVMLDLTPTKLAKDLHVSNSVISKHISGEKVYYPCNIYLAEVLFNIRILEYEHVR
jgi:hypothetical protein